MEKFRITFVCCCIILVAAICLLPKNNSEYLRIHIRADSNDIADQNVKYEVRDIVVNYLTPKLKNCNSKEEAAARIKDSESAVKALIDRHLKEKGFDYTSEISVRNEKFPTRRYENLTLEEGYYDAVIIELGSGKGDNWWCVVYPPLCFLGNEDIEYRSKILELIDKNTDG